MNKKIENIVEDIARMNNTERHQFIETLAKKWPTLAASITVLLDMYLMDKASE